jgi:hypothetical protein
MEITDRGRFWIRFKPFQLWRFQWRADLQVQQTREQPSLPWLAYTQGGVDALGQLLPPGSEEHDA